MKRILAVLALASMTTAAAAADKYVPPLVDDVVDAKTTVGAVKIEASDYTGKLRLGYRF